MAGFEPAISCSRSTRNFRLSYILNQNNVQSSQTHSETPKSVQRESNPRFLHGKQVGYRYIMGAKKTDIGLSNSKSTRRDSNPRHRITGAVSSPLDDQCHQSLQWDQTDLNRHQPG